MMPPEGCERYREWIGAFVLGKLEGAEYEEMQRHINGCAECWVEARELGPVVAALAEADPDRIDEDVRPPDDLEESILAPTSEDIPRARPRGWHFGWLVPAAAAIFAVVIGLTGLASYLDQDEPMGSSGSSVPSEPSAEDPAPDIVQEQAQAIGPEDVIPPEESFPESDVKGSFPGGERPGTAPKKSEPGRGVHEPPASALAASALAASATAASATAASVPASAPPGEPSAATAPPASSAPSASSAPPVGPPASAPASSAPPVQGQY
jgi:hypothetical protein